MRTLALALVLAAAGCAAPDALSSGPAAAPSPRAIAALTDSLASGDRSAVVQRALARSGLTPFTDYSQSVPSRYALSRPTPVVGAFLPGQHPLGRSDLVVLAAPLGGPDLPAVLEAMRVLAARSEWIIAPERSVEVALWSGARSLSDGVRQSLAATPWARDAIRAVVVIGPAPDSLAGLPVVSVEAPDPLALAGALVDRLAEVARIPPPPARLDELATDTLATRR